MTSNRKKLLCFVGVASLGLGFLAVQINSEADNTNKKVVAGETEYSLNFSSSLNKVSAVTAETTLNVQTTSGNTINFAYNNTATRLGYWGKLNEGGYFHNTTVLSGLKRIEITFADTNGVKISYGWSSSLYRVSDVALAATEAGGTATYAFENEAPSFFKIAFDSAAASIKTIMLVYSCSRTADPYYAGTEGLAMTLSPDSTYYSVTGYTGTATEVVIASSYKGLPVKEIGNASFYNNKTITTVTIPSSVTSIGDGAFNSCSSLASVTIPDSVASIGDAAFFACSKLASVAIPSSVTSIGKDAFNRCSSLASVSIPDSVASIGDDAFQGCSKLASVTIPDSVTSIGDAVFCECYSLASVSIPDSVTSIGNSAFSRCSKLASVSISSSVTSIGSGAFSCCYSLASVSIPSSVTSIGGGAFSGCACASLAISADNQNYSTDGKAIFNKDKTTIISYVSSDSTYEIPSSVTSIGSDAFNGCSGLTSVAIPDSVASIGAGAFWDCSHLASVTIPSSVTSIGNAAFWDCSSLTSVAIPDSVTSIGEAAFWYCSYLPSVAIPDSVTSIGNDAFQGCSRLCIFCQVSAKPTGWNSSWNPNKQPVIWKAAYRGSATSDSYTLTINWDFSQILSYSGSATNVDVPSVLSGTTITEISATFLANKTTVAYLRLPDTVTKIDASAVRGCTALKTIVLPSSIASIGSGAFSGCTALEACYYKGTPEQWTALNFTTFGDSVAYYSEADKSGVTDHYYWHYDTDGVTPIIWNA